MPSNPPARLGADEEGSTLGAVVFGMAVMALITFAVLWVLHAPAGMLGTRIVIAVLSSIVVALVVVILAYLSAWANFYP